MFPILPPPGQDSAHDNLGQSPEQVYAYAAELLHGGTPPAAVRQKLIELGFEEKAASTVVHDLLAAPAGRSSRAAQTPMVPKPAPQADYWVSGRALMAWGALWFIGGLLLTFGSLAASRGGSYVIAWGAIVYGAIDFCRGASRQ